MSDGDFKSCPYCKEQIRASAIKCRYCGEWLEEPPEVVGIGTGTAETPPPISAELKQTEQSPKPPELVRATEDTKKETPANDRSEARNYFGRHWRGDASLGISFWVNGVLFSVGLAVAFAVVAQIGIAMNPWFIVPILVVAFLLWFSTVCWQVVGIWRSSSKHPNRGGSRGVATLAKVMMVLWIAVAVKSILTDWVSLGNGTYKAIAFQSTIPKCEIRVLPNGKEIEIRGGIQMGSAKKFQVALATAPQVKVVRVNSIGGLIAEAQTMARTIRERGLDTYTDGCASAAVLVFLSGKERTVSDGAKLGFHAPAVFGLDGGEKEFSESMVRTIMQSGGVTDEFIKKVLATPNEQVWYPTLEEMRLARIVTKEDAPLKTSASSMATFLENPTNTDGFKPQATGHEEIDRLMKTFADFSRRWGSLFVDMNTELEKAGEPDVYADQTLQNQEKIREALSIQTIRKQIIERYRSKAHEEVSWLTNEFAAMKFSEATAKGMLKGTDRSVETGRTQADQLLNLRSDVETAKEQFLRFMLKTFSDYRLINSKISFTKQADVERYKAMGKTISDASKALEEFEAAMLKSVDASKEQLKKLAK